MGRPHLLAVREVNVAIIDYGVGNLGSLRNALHHVGATLVAPEDADKLVLPGVGHFGYCADKLRQSAHFPYLIDAVRNNVQTLGICVGMQLLFEGSDEAPETQGLGLIPGRCVKVNSPRLPIVGWSEVSSTGWLSGEFYFVHSYAAQPTGATIAWTSSPDYVAAVEQGNLTGVQMHVEKSGKAGLAFLAKWVNG